MSRASVTLGLLSAALGATELAGATAPGRFTPRTPGGLPVQSTADPTDGLVVLRRVPEGRVPIAGGTFTMGSDTVAQARAQELCMREPLGASVMVVPDVDGSLVRESLHCRTAQWGSESVAHSVTLSRYFIDRTEVRVADYLRCVTVGICAAPAFTADDVRFAQPDFPVVLVTWDDAAKYCRYAHGRLPTEAEWELAARGLEERTFPWGNVWNAHLSNHGSLALDPTDATDGFAGLAPVGSFVDGATRLGLLDMAGNAAEWVDDAYDPELHLDRLRRIHSEPPPYPPAAQRDPHHTNGAWRIVRGGSYLRGAYEQRSAWRSLDIPTERRRDLGFRCAGDEP